MRLLISVEAGVINVLKDCVCVLRGFRGPNDASAAVVTKSASVTGGHPARRPRHYKAADSNKGKEIQ